MKLLINTKNVAIVSILILANFLAFLLGGYFTLTPIFYLIGFVGTMVISAWVGIKMSTKNLLFIIVTSTLLAIIDEYAHTSVGTLSYFDQAVPSPLTVFGWSIFMVFLVAAAKVLMKIPGLTCGATWITAGLRSTGSMGRPPTNGAWITHLAWKRLSC